MLKRYKKISIDQISFTFPIKENKGYQGKPKELMDIDLLFHFSKILSQPVELKKAYKGYNKALQWGTKETGTITASYHTKRTDMGLSIEFTGTGKKLYEEKCRQKGLEVNWKRIIEIACQAFGAHVARIDIAIDLINFNYSVDKIHRKLKSGQYVFLDAGNRVISLKRMQFIGEGKESQTLYVGSRKSDSYMRIYDKKTEQMKKKGVNYAVAVASNDFLRIEAEIKHRQAHKIGSEIASLTYENLDSFLVGQILKRWKLVYKRES